ncbi:sulfurtransferase [Polaribacter sp.]|uniref:sulfurtransferase n=1 Tax=Polaribacter sp. TaxID=1920175 RepID=UPI003EF5B9E6
MSLKIKKPLVSIEWLMDNLENEHIIVLDATMPKVTDVDQVLEAKLQIKNAVFFDIKTTFSDKNSPFPNTILSPEEFQEKAQELGVNNNSLLVVYDDLGIYSSARVWWMFQLMGFHNIAVLDGGFPLWKSKNYPVEAPKRHQVKKGNFTVNYQPEKIKFTKDVLLAIENKNIIIADARSKGRFFGTIPEPRGDVKSGHIPNATSLPFSEIQEKGKMKTEEELKEIFGRISKNKEEFIFTCGTGITASILALGAEIAKIKNYAVYDGSWTEWGSTHNLPIEI